MSFEAIVLVVGGTLTGLFAGLLYAFNVAVVPAFRNVKGIHHIAVMQALNIHILNPVFFLSFFGPAILLPLAAIQHWGGPQSGWLLAAALLHIVGGIGATAVGNIPLNNEIAKIDISKLSDTDADRISKEFQGPGTPWMRWHAVRTLAAIAATAIVFVVCLAR